MSMEVEEGSDTYRSEMVNISMMSFISTNHGYNILEGSIFRQSPVIYCNGRAAGAGTFSIAPLSMSFKYSVYE